MNSKFKLIFSLTTALLIFSVVFQEASYAVKPSRRHTLPAAPATLVAAAISQSEINLTWVDQSSNESGFKLESAPTSSGTWIQIAIIAAGVTNYKHTGLSGSTTYYYRVRSYNSSGNSAYSNTAAAKTTAADLAPCGNFSLSPTSASFDSLGGSGVVKVSADAGCGWSAVSNASWIAIISATGIGPGSVSYSYTPNTNTVSRTGSMTIAGKTFTITQAAAVVPVCKYTVTFPSNWVPNNGGTTKAYVYTTSGCRWTAESDVSWYTIISGQTGTGNGEVLCSVLANPLTITRTATLTIAGKVSTATQQAKSSAFCSYMFSESPNIYAASTGGTNNITVYTGATGCDWTAKSDSSWVTIGNGQTGSGGGMMTYQTAPNAGISARSAKISFADHDFIVTQGPYDTTAPSTPSGVMASPLSTIQNNLKWNASVDTGGSEMGGYKIYRDGNPIGSTPNLRFADQGLIPNTLYCYTVSAYDREGNESMPSVSACSTTLPTSETRVPELGFGSKKLKTVAVRLNFRNYTAEPTSKEYFQRAFFNPAMPEAVSDWSQVSTHADISDNSYGQLGFEGDILDYMTLPIDVTCDGMQILKAAVDTAAKRGIDLYKYDAFLMDIAHPQGCSSRSSSSFINLDSTSLDGRRFFITSPGITQDERVGISINGQGYSYPFTPALGGWGHVFGHFMGLYESSGVVCPGLTLNADLSQCGQRRYFDTYSAMGTGEGGYEGHYPARSKEAFGWIKVPQVRSSGDYYINPLELSESAVKALKVPAGNRRGFYYLEFRRMLGVEKNSNVNGLIIHYVDTTNNPVMGSGNEVFRDGGGLLDMTPSSSFADSALAVGKTFTDPFPLGNGFTITPISLDNNSIKVSIQNLPVGDVTPPKVSITSPANGATVSGANVRIDATWSDDQAIGRVELYQDGVLTKIQNPDIGCQGAWSGAVCSRTDSGTLLWDASKVALGQHILTLKVYDTQNSTSSQITLNVIKDEPPSHTFISSPLKGATIGSSVTIWLNNYEKACTLGGGCVFGKGEQPLDADLALFQYYLDGKLVAWKRGTETYPSWTYFDNHFSCENFWFNRSCTWDTTQSSFGQHSITLKAYDHSSNVFTQTITVNKPSATDSPEIT